MTPEQFRTLALALPGAIEGEHMRHPDFRAGGRIFATLGPDLTWGMVKLDEEQQDAFVRAEPRVFEPVAGAWGRGGATYVRLRAARTPSVRRALEAAWSNAAPKQPAASGGTSEARRAGAGAGRGRRPSARGRGAGPGAQPPPTGREER